jgi:hypothetical protein
MARALAAGEMRAQRAFRIPIDKTLERLAHEREYLRIAGRAGSSGCALPHILLHWSAPFEEELLDGNLKARFNPRQLAPTYGIQVSTDHVVAAFPILEVAKGHVCCQAATMRAHPRRVRYMQARGSFVKPCQHRFASPPESIRITQGGHARDATRRLPSIDDKCAALRVALGLEEVAA